jgi:hypothetical protein
MRGSDQGATMSAVTEQSTFEAVLEVLGDGRWHTEKELAEVAYFPRRWVDELAASGYAVESRDVGELLVRLADDSRGR